ncbi:MAG: hypothetical protein A2845_04505 [Candidatus Lloydbacteria bacterium RIFCSPHIGHO2_01_FULL_49_22]|uniref:Fibronectin type-III domain-containing protein n=1 Tax=Candidatus Lloydbacteria bacterium RIFCSPHIGHO2_01_FULL_49_22 TaxID=1798658 RepID=A0A1G2CW68_9BACT|nr:MAG: hypothetical protein A2845_04505 [Candidatus Lloydbacteria bacterium RIFCSPHIGHO2_01_FULL_49_22]OGZ10078.1 MAG: hypothetical protein A3C14_00540 [Candidatus Lloydbacteria bacterium RIFCSPHIGHO2_02_FULL_50_18]
MNTKLCGVVSVLLFVLFIPFTTFAVSPQVTSNTTTIAELMQQIAVLQVQIEELKADLANTKQELAVVKEEIRITKTLRRGMEDEEVKKLQEFLSTMPDVYPEGLITGYFGFLTEKAVKKFQEKNASDVLKPLGLSKGTGFVGMKTMEKMNDVLDESGVLSNAASTNEEKVTICHFPPENPINKQTIAIGVSALPAHKTHGDTVGACNNEQVSPIQNPSPTSTACTTDAKMCSDGSSVARISPKCEFAPCSVIPVSQYYIKITAPSRWETWTTGSSVYIKWTSNIPATHNIMIVRVRDSAGSEFNLLRDTQNDGIELLTIPSTLASGMYHFEMKTVFGNQTVFSEIEGIITIVNLNNPGLTPVTETKIITPSVDGGHGVLGGTSVVAVGSDQTFTITPMPGYQVASVIVDGVNQGSMMSYTFTNVQTNHSIAVSFSPIQTASTAQYAITVTQGVGGTISPGTISIASGGGKTFTITPGSGYQISTVTVDGVNQGAISTYTFTNVTSAHTITLTTTPLSVPQPVSGFTMSAGAPGFLSFSWTPRNDVAGYRIYLTNTATNITTTRDFSPANQSGVGNFGYEQGVQYSAFIVSVDAAGNISIPSNTLTAITTKLTRPTNLTVSATSPTAVSLAWTASEGIVYKYKITRWTGSVSMNSPQSIMEVLAPATSYVDATVGPGVTYIYWVKSVSVENYQSVDISAPAITTPTT